MSYQCDSCKKKTPAIYGYSVEGTPKCPYCGGEIGETKVRKPEPEPVKEPEED